mmetsp:Transcript_73430/g.238806  ORF Transcript_73430/g.238806 Transcript_73430/m.238806 type:complete len:206 (-) Transcript_73430:3339-3956(-)
MRRGLGLDAKRLETLVQAAVLVDFPLCRDNRRAHHQPRARCMARRPGGAAAQARRRARRRKRRPHNGRRDDLDAQAVLDGLLVRLVFAGLDFQPRARRCAGLLRAGTKAVRLLRWRLAGACPRKGLHEIPRHTGHEIDVASILLAIIELQRWALDALGLARLFCVPWLLFPLLDGQMLLLHSRHRWFFLGTLWPLARDLLDPRRH